MTATRTLGRSWSPVKPPATAAMMAAIRVRTWSNRWSSRGWSRSDGMPPRPFYPVERFCPCHDRIIQILLVRKLKNQMREMR